MQNSRLLELAIKGLEAEKARIEQELEELRNQTPGQTGASRKLLPVRQQPQTTASAGKPHRKMSAAARNRLSETMKKWHAARKAATASKK